MTLPAQSILIIGGGFSGMSAAIELRKQGADVELVEMDDNWCTEGAGIHMTGPSLRALQDIGVFERFTEEGCLQDVFEMYTGDGQLLMRVPAALVPGTDIRTSGAIMRPVLSNILAEAAIAANVKVKLGTSFTSIKEHSDGVEVSFSDGTSANYDMVVGADGVYSSVRKALFPDAQEPQYTGQGVWRAVVPRFGVDGSPMFLGETGKVGFNPVSEDSMYMFYTEARPDRDRIPEDQMLPHLLKLLEPFKSELIAKVREALDENCQILYRPLDDILLPRPWYKGRVLLIGDSAHATTPHLASGAGMAIEDAVVLGQEFSKGGELTDVLDRYQNRRWERCRLVVNNSLRLGEIELDNGYPKEEHAQIMAVSAAALLAPF
ncbi:FAD-dependent oxidoreductase [Marinomonas posidonica]|uniref:FAD dependent oxidoreductase n=1 Tax=Marinomonas posidonica (strain CECT 7376 / NCIMB 14433 / IVIA-Po-181) TaxID=491952 RepID=F6D134_MARPP|nr:FAD-dependent oxidoreductase [Marinomonas posidonica]AEF54841.1 FAD dependent oxidoreductase [Marinomonas posidonica IVIA-Po-181]